MVWLDCLTNNLKTLNGFEFQVDVSFETYVSRQRGLLLIKNPERLPSTAVAHFRRYHT